MGLFRSEDMSLYEITIPKDNSWEIMNKLGDTGSMHFINLNKEEQVFNLTFAPFIKRCEETEKRISFIEQECKRHNVPMEKPISVREFLNTVNNMQSKMKKAGNLFFESIEEDIKNKEKFVQEQTRKGKEIHDSFNLLFEYRTVLRKANNILQDRGRGMVDEGGAPHSLNGEDVKEEVETPLVGPGNISVGHVAGTIDKAEEMRFKKLIFRATRGNALCYFDDFKAPIKDYFGNVTQKSVYVVIFQEGGSIREKIIRICDSFLGERFDIPTGGVNAKIQEINNKINDTRNVMQATFDEVKKYLVSINRAENTEASAIQIYKWFVIKEKALYENLNKLKMGDKLLFGLFWCPQDQTKHIKDEIQRIKQDRNITGPQLWMREGHGITPPSYFKTNEFTAPFQEIVNTYGIPGYKEVNPALFAIITFPFLFGVMFGDIAHGSMLFLFGCFMCIFADALKNSAIGPLIQARYLITMMGFFATFCGICYNDFASIPITGTSCYQIISPANKDEPRYVTRPDEECVYTIGVDYIWFLTGNELTYVNSMKMKISVIFGVCQMSLGIFMKSFNAVYFNRKLDLIFEFIPQITLMMCLFGFMDFLIVCKWLQVWPDNASTAPSIIAIMINMFLGFGTLVEKALPILGDKGSSTQQTVSIILLVTGLICVPLMLLVKPLALRCEMSGHHVHNAADGPTGFHRLNSDDDERHENSSIQDQNDISKYTAPIAKNDFNIDEILKNEAGEGENHVFSEIFIHQLIETIEFVLGTVSNTASYLRLWALSLAHSQLAAVFFDKLLGDMAFNGKGSFIMMFLLLPVWASFSLFVLMCMDSMECFLHTLRLHWVEFQNKFYKGNGYKFEPFSFAPILEEEKNKI
jgi:V-type H+-transporting ATPase subunit a